MTTTKRLNRSVVINGFLLEAGHTVRAEVTKGKYVRIVAKTYYKDQQIEVRGTVQRTDLIPALRR